MCGGFFCFIIFCNVMVGKNVIVIMVDFNSSLIVMDWLLKFSVGIVLNIVNKMLNNNNDLNWDKSLFCKLLSLLFDLNVILDDEEV